MAEIDLFGSDKQDSASRRPFGGGPTNVVTFRCPNCFGTGNVVALKINGPAVPYAFKCSCENGRRRNRAFPLWSSDRRKEYEVLEQQQYEPA